MAKYLAGIDIGTTGARCTLFDLDGAILANEYSEYGATYPKPGWVEQDLDEMIAVTFEASKAAIAKSGIKAEEIASIGFSTQRSVTVPVYEDGRKVRPMLSWQDARTNAEVEDMLELIDAESYYAISGMPMGTTWNVTKMLWMRKNEPELFQQTFKFVQVQDAVLKAFGAEDFYTDTSDMSMYGLWDVENLRWSDKLLELFDFTPDMMGKPLPPGTKVAQVSPDIAAKTGFAVGTPICVGAGDQNCGAVGMGAVRGGMVTVNLGTGGLIALSADRYIPGSGGMMISNHAVPGMWQVEGLSNASGSAYRWFRDTVGKWERKKGKKKKRSPFDYLNKQAEKAVPGSKGLLFLPYLGTAATPRWNANARACFIGMSFAHGRPEMARAVMEGVALEMRDIIDVWLQAGVEITTLRLGGGVTKSPVWNQIQADVYGRPVQTLKIGESTVLGAAILGGVGAGVFSSIQEATDKMVEVTNTIEPNMANHAVYEDMYDAYVKAYKGLASSGAFDQLAKVQTQ